MTTPSASLPTSSDLTALMAELRSSYVPSKHGMHHLGAYAAERTVAQQNFENAKRLEANGEDLTDFVLLKFLPHAKTKGNADKGAWISIAPAITKDLKQWFEGAKWTLPESWPAVATAVWRFVRNCSEHPDRLEVEIKEFSGNPITKGLQTGFLSPILHALRPEHFGLVNSKSRKALGWATGATYGADLSEFPAINRTLLAFVEEHRETFALPGLSPLDSFDVFSHWLVAVKTLPLTNGTKRGWTELVHWAHRFFEQESFEDDERTYKLKIAGQLAVARVTLNQGGDWVAALKRAFAPPNNLTRWQLHDVFLKWCKASEAAASAALAAIWDSDREPLMRFKQFFDRLPEEVVPTPGQRVCLASFLHMALDGIDYPIYRAAPFKTGYDLTSFHYPAKGASDLEVYEHALSFLDRLLKEGEEAGLGLRDRLDAQGVLWAVTNRKETASKFMDPPELARYLAFLSQVAKPTQYWKLAPGANARLWEECRNGGFASIGWGKLGDVSALSEAEFRDRQRELEQQDSDYTAAGARQVWRFAKEIQEGDLLLANQGTSRVLALGEVTGSYHFEPGEEHPHRVPVDWYDQAQRNVHEPSWVKSLMPLTKDKFEAIAKPQPLVATGHLGVQAFSLLEALHGNPTRTWVMEHQEQLRIALVTPLEQLFENLAAGLPAEAKKDLETETGLLSRLLKNDWGKGGAWTFLWGAFYPKGSRRISGAQLFVGVHRDRLEFGFYIGDYGSQQRERFLANCKRFGEELPALLAPCFEDRGLRFGSRPEDRALDATAQFGVPWRDWLASPAAAGVRVAVSLAAAEVSLLSLPDLVSRVSACFRDLFPLVQLATQESPLPPIRRYLRVDLEDDVGTRPPYELYQLATDTGLSEELLSRWIRAVQRKKQAILCGPPGTGKTFVAEHLSRHLVSGGRGFVEVLQLHPAYAYEDFIQGIRPRLSSNGALSYEIEDGRFLRFCERAEDVGENELCVLILDEINRANLSRVFGELMYLLEYREREVRLAAGRTLKVPSNVRILGTMNTADRSIALVDHALRRRFAFLELRPDYEVLRTRLAPQAHSVSTDGLIATLRAVNQAINDPHHEVGISFFLQSNLAEQLEDIWTMEVLPYLEEYFFDQPEKVKPFAWGTVGPRFFLGT